MSVLLLILAALATIGLGIEIINTPQQLVSYYISLTITALIVFLWAAINNRKRQGNLAHSLKVGTLCSSISTGTLLILVEVWSTMTGANIATGTDHLTTLAGILFLIINVLVLTGAWLFIEERVKSNPD